MVDSLMDMFNLPEAEAIKSLEKDDFDFDKVVNKIQKARQKEKEKEEKKAKEKEKQEQLKREKELEKKVEL